MITQPVMRKTHITNLVIFVNKSITDEVQIFYFNPFSISNGSKKQKKSSLKFVKLKLNIFFIISHYKTGRRAKFSYQDLILPDLASKSSTLFTFSTRTLLSMKSQVVLIIPKIIRTIRAQTCILDQSCTNVGVMAPWSLFH